MSEERPLYGSAGQEQIEELKVLYDKAAQSNGLETKDTLRFMEAIIEALGKMAQMIEALQARDRPITVTVQGPPVRPVDPKPGSPPRPPRPA